MRTKSLLTALACAAAFYAYADEPSAPPPEEAAGPVTELPPVVVVATRTNTPSDELGRAFDIITAEELAAVKYPDLTAVLMDQPSITFKGYGPYDSNGQARVRGLSTYHTKLLVNGMPFMDASSTQVFPMLSGLSLGQVERIEVLKGVSSLQGTQAMGGVINIVTKRPAEGFHGKLSLEAGSHAHFTTRGEVTGRNDLADFTLTLGRVRERGISTVAHDAYGNVNLDDDHYRRMDYAGSVGLQLGENWRAEIGGLFQDIDEEYDSGYTYSDWMTGDTIAVADEDDVWVRRTMGNARLSGTGLLDDALDLELRYSAVRADRSYLNHGHETYRYVGTTQTAAAQGTYRFSERNDLTMGYEFLAERAQNYEAHKETLDREHRTHAVFGGYNTEPFDNLFLSLNLRYSYHSEFGDQLTADASAKYYFEQSGTTLRAAIGKGYRSPSVYELYAPPSPYYSQGGNPDLKPETNISWEAGVDQEFLEKRLRLSATYFENRVHNYIQSVFDAKTALYRYTQIQGMHARGVELAAVCQPTGQLRLKAAYTWQHARDTATGDKRVAYLPRNKATFEATWYPMEDKRLALSLGGAWTDHRWNGTGDKLEDFLLVHAAASYQLTQSLELYARIENLLNTNYTLADDYGTRYNTYGRCYYIGLTYQF
ncbi:MAG: TonB-dependent receptor [Victivallales bacterium]|nr:TonB-dependent receptor [Victivallales bacterium]